MIKSSAKISPSLKSEDKKRRSVFYLWETLAISAHCSKSQRSFLGFVRSFAEDTYTYRFDKKRMNTISYVFANSIIEHVRLRARLKRFSEVATSENLFIGDMI